MGRGPGGVTLHIVSKKIHPHIGIRKMHKFGRGQRSNSNRNVWSKGEIARKRLTISLYKYIIIINHPHFDDFVWSGVLSFAVDQPGSGAVNPCPRRARLAFCIMFTARAYALRGRVQKAVSRSIGIT